MRNASHLPFCFVEIFCKSLLFRAVKLAQTPPMLITAACVVPDHTVQMFNVENRAALNNEA